MVSNIGMNWENFYNENILSYIKSLQENPFGFANQSQMWNNPDFPPVIDKKSTQLLCVYLFTICLFLLLCVSLGCLFLNASHGLCITIGLTSFVCLMCWGILRWIMKN